MIITIGRLNTAALLLLIATFGVQADVKENDLVGTWKWASVEGKAVLKPFYLRLSADNVGVTIPTTAMHLAILILLLFCTVNSAEARDGQMIRGNGYEGMIATPPMLADFRYSEGSIFSTGLWTPSPELIRQAEARLPKAIAQCAVPPKAVATYYVPRFYTPKGGSPVAGAGHERVETDVSDSKQDNFLYEVGPNLAEYKRQYLGVTSKGKKYLLLSFIHASCMSDPSIKKTWGHGWVAVLDGGDLFWGVFYDPATGTFSEWECNGET
jgi:hypothetical protein